MSKAQEWRRLRREIRRAKPEDRAALEARLARLEAEMRPKELAQVRAQEQEAEDG